MLQWVAKRLKHVWSNSDQTPQEKNYGSQIRKKHVDTSGWASVVGMNAPNMFDTAGQTNKTSPIKHENQKRFKLFDRMFDGPSLLSNTTKQHQTRWPNDKMVGHQTMFDVA